MAQRKIAIEQHSNTPMSLCADQQVTTQLRPIALA